MFVKRDNVLMHDAFSNCIVKDRKIMFQQSFNEDQIRLLTSVFTRDLLDYEIPHYRVVGIKYNCDCKILGINDEFGISPIELGDRVSEIVPISMGGNKEGFGYMWKNSTYKFPPEFMPGHEEFYKILETNEEIGQLLYRNDGKGSDMYTSKLTYSYFLGDQKDEAIIRDGFLMNDSFITKTKNINMTSNTIFFFKKGKGVVDYKDNAMLFSTNKGINIMPCRTVYDLSKFFTCKFYTSGDYIELYYRRDINEEGLQKILRDYGKGLGE